MARALFSRQTPETLFGRQSFGRHSVIWSGWHASAHAAGSAGGGAHKAACSVCACVFVFVYACVCVVGACVCVCLHACVLCVCVSATAFYFACVCVVCVRYRPIAPLQLSSLSNFFLSSLSMPPSPFSFLLLPPLSHLPLIPILSTPTPSATQPKLAASLQFNPSLQLHCNSTQACSFIAS